MNKTIKVILALLIFSPLLSYGQDVFAIQWDKPYYTAGESVKYNISAPPSFVNARGVVQVKVLPIDHPEMEHISFIRMGGESKGSGYYDIRIDALSGQYNIVISALDKVDMKVKIIGNGSFTVINPFVDSEILDIMVKSNKSEGEANAQINFTAAANPQEIKAQVTSSTGEAMSGDLSYFITNLDQIYGEGTLGKISTFDVTSGVKIEDPSSELFYSNYAGGRVNPGSRVLGAYMTQSNEFVYVNAKSDDFILTMDDFYGTQSIQLIDQQLNVFPVEKRMTNGEDVTESIDKVIISKYVEDYIDRRRIEQYFGASTVTQAVSEMDKDRKKASPRKASQTFNLKEYENFVTLAKFFEEVSTPLKMEQVDGKFVAQLANPQYRGQSRLYFKGTPLFIVDGVVTTDVDYVANLNFSSLNTIELYSSPSILREYYGMMGKSGVVRITTSIPNISIPGSTNAIVKLNGLQEKRITTLNTEYTQNSRFPLLGATLLSVGNAPTNSVGNINLTLPKTNEQGNFLITAMFTGADGSVGIGKHTYSNK